MIRWQDHVAGFVGRHKYLDRAYRLIQGISVTTASAVSAFPVDYIVPVQLQTFSVLAADDSYSVGPEDESYTVPVKDEDYVA